MAQGLDPIFKERVRAVLDGEATEAALRKLLEEGEARARLLDGELLRAEDELTRRADDPTTSIADLAATMRRVNELRPGLAALRELLDALDERAREFRAAWLARR